MVDGVVLPATRSTRPRRRSPRDVPLLIGWNKDEMTLFNASEPWFGNARPRRSSQSASTEIAGGEEKGKALLAALRELRPGYSPTYLPRARSRPSRMFLGSVQLAERKAAQHQAPVYVYELVWETPIGNGIFKSPHTLEIPFVFANVDKAAVLVGAGDAPAALERQMSDAWIAFARTGNPNTPGLPEWPRYDAARRATMVFDTTSRVVDDPDRAIREALAADEQSLVELAEPVTWSRRHLLGAGLAGAGWLTVGGVPAAALDDDDLAPPDLAGKTLNLVLRYRTDPERIARVLPPALEPDEVAEVTIDWWLHYPDRGGENLFYPGPYTESGIHVTARWQGQRGMFQIGMPLDQDWGRVAGRENVGLVKKDGVPRLSRQGRRVRADLTRRGKLLYRIETEVLDSPAHPMLWHRETGFGAFLYRYRLDPDWRRGPLGPDPVELWLRVLGGKRGVYPQEMVEGAPRECDARPHALRDGRAVAARSVRGVSAARDRRRELSRDRPLPASGSRPPRGEDRDPHRAAADDRSEGASSRGRSTCTTARSPRARSGRRWAGPRSGPR